MGHIQLGCQLDDFALLSFCSLYHVNVSLSPVWEISAFIMGQLRACTCVLVVLLHCEVCCCSVGGPPTSHTVLSVPHCMSAFSIDILSDIERQTLKVQLLQCGEEKGFDARGITSSITSRSLREAAISLDCWIDPPLGVTNYIMAHYCGVDT